MKERVEITLNVNGERISRAVEARMHTIDFLREELGLLSARASCEHGVCGACTIRLDGEIVRGCLILAASLDGARVETIEGLSDSGEVRDLQDAFIRHNACQCGYCTPAMLITAADFLINGGSANRDAIRDHISGNYCRCTGYQAIVDAIEDVARSRNKEAQA
ncbi:CoxS Aerobic-type carbon monoxide dehydrogenase, small subunit CoxS/CutS homologs [Rhabdaerophilaceae bacterium]